MTFLRADGPDLDIKEVFQLDDSDSSSSSDASSVPNEDRARFLAIQSQCATINTFHWKSLPGSSQTGPSTIISIDRALVQDQTVGPQIPAPIGLEIVPWHPVLDVIALQIWPEVVAAKCKPVKQNPSPTLILAKVGALSGIHPGSAIETEQSSTMDGQVNGSQSGPEIQIEQIRPSPAEERGQKATMTRQKRKTLSLPEIVSNSDARTPLVQSSVRRSSRLSVGDKGYCPVIIDKEPSKKCKNWLLQINEETGQAGPVSIEVLQGWGINCGVDPMDLTDGALMQAPPPSQAPNVDDAE
jgi:hypothetical protein